jgi:hypothetical protein
MPIPDDITKWRLEANDVITNMEHHLKGEFLEKKAENVDGKWIAWEEWVCKEKARFMNDTGAKAVVTTATMIINKVVFLSNISEDDIYAVCKDIEIALARLIYDNWSEFEVTRRPDPIIHILMDLVFTGLMRAKGGGERDSLTRAESIVRSIREGTDGHRKIFPFGGGGKNEERK